MICVGCKIRADLALQYVSGNVVHFGDFAQRKVHYLVAVHFPKVGIDQVRNFYDVHPL